MNKADLINWIASEADISKAAAGRALDAFTGAIRSELRKGNKVALLGFGTFEVIKRTARWGRNPRTAEPVRIKAAKLVKFRAGQALKGVVNV
jgi:DNA-binding protein HU-beta